MAVPPRPVLDCSQLLLPGDGIPPFQVAQETRALNDAKMMGLGESPLEEDVHLLESLRPDHDTAQYQERCADRTRQQDPRDAGDDQQGTDLLGEGPLVGDLSGIAHRRNRRPRLTAATRRGLC